MNAEQAASYAQALLASVTIGVILPAFLLVCLLGFAWVLLWQAQKRPDFDIADLLREVTDEIDPSTGLRIKRVSTWRFSALMCFAIHSAYFYASLFQKPDPQLFAWYGLIWAGTPAALALANKWDGGLPFAARGGPT